jgi:ESS family glutamate:Na+ symporter
MTVSSLFGDMIIIALFMLTGFFAREIIKPIQRLFLPSSLIGGLIALILGQQMLGIVEIPASFSSFSNVLIAPILAALLFGVTINRKKIVGYLDYICVEQAIYGMQMCLGAGLGAALAVIWPGLPLGWGSMGVFAFQGGHGNAGAAGQTYTELGIPENLSIGMVLATFGLIVAMLAGMIMVNIGVRKGWSKFVKDPQKQPSWYYGGALPEDKRGPIGLTVTSSISINHLALQAGWLLTAVFAGRMLIQLVGLFWDSVSVLPTVMQGIAGGAIVWNAARLVKLERFIDVKFIHQMSGFLLEVVVLTAMATLDLELISTFIVPIVVYTLVCSAVTLMIAFGGCKLFCREEWFEKALMAYGVGTGNTATGLALVRAVDPDSQSAAPDNHGIYSAVMCWKEAFAGLVPVWMMTGLGMTMGVGAVMCAVCLGIGFALFARPGKA